MDSQGNGTARTVELLARNGLTLESGQIQALSLYVSLLLDWNSRVNLISRKDEENVWNGHILHSLSVLLRLKFPPGLSVLDLGTGGGLPGIPLAIASPDSHFVLLDSIRKKTQAVEAIIAALPVGNVQVVTGRAEDLLRTGPLERPFHLIITRAVAPLVDLLKWTRGLYERREHLRVACAGLPSGDAIETPILAALKGGDLEEEIAAARLRHPSLRVHDVPLGFDGSAEAGLEGKRLLIVSLH